jgi:hypothetical protein
MCWFSWPCGFGLYLGLNLYLVLVLSHRLGPGLVGLAFILASQSCEFGLGLSIPGRGRGLGLGCGLGLLDFDIGLDEEGFRGTEPNGGCHIQ